VIDRREILELAADLSLRPDVVEKDYSLAWLLAGIAHHPELSTWLFKGGTCLKKAWFETYRFSEDLDFTLERDEQLDESFLRRTMREVAEWVYRESGLLVPGDGIDVEPYRNARGRAAALVKLSYRGPLGARGSLPRIRLDLTADEQIVLPPERRRISHDYTDEPPDGIWAHCYAFAEVFAEKIRALGDRARPRDLYDVVNLFRREDALGARDEIRTVLAAKCAYKGLPVPTLPTIELRRAELEADWEDMLGHQLPQLPPFETYWSELGDFFAWLVSRGPFAAAPSPYRLAPGEDVLRPALGTLGRLGLMPRPLETIRFAAASRLCVDLDYVDESGKRKVRRIEPYSLRRTRDGKIVLHALRYPDGKHRSYRVDRIRGAIATSQAFRPRYAIELGPKRS
jgi:predicted nucleotidyltransferase component of viral defense system